MVLAKRVKMNKAKKRKAIAQARHRAALPSRFDV